MDHEQCAACGFDGATYDDASLLSALRALEPRWRELIGRSGDELRIRPEPEVWSALEYAAHSRDITALHAFGVEQALTTDEPSLPGDELIESAVAAYAEADSDDVVDALGAAATRLARPAADAGPAAWSRGLTIGDARSDVRRMLEHALHDSTHHLDDVERGLARLRASST